MFPLWYFLVPYGIFLGFATLSVFFNLFHIANFGIQSLKTTIVLFLYFFSFAGIIWLSFTLLSDVPWDENVDVRTIIQVPSFMGPSSKTTDL